MTFGRQPGAPALQDARRYGGTVGVAVRLMWGGQCSGRQMPLYSSSPRQLLGVASSVFTMRSRIWLEQLVAHPYSCAVPGATTSEP